MASKVRVPSGVYKPCTGAQGCGGKGYIRGTGGVRLPHARCGGDGWIKVGRKRSGGARGKLAKPLRKLRNFAVGGGGAYLAAGWAGGPLAASLVLVVLGLLVFLAAHRAIAGAVRE